jgi:rare lipoprotein A (peptidoglycan hydrolase)
MIRVTALKLALLAAAVPHPHKHHDRPWRGPVGASEYGPADSGGPLACGGGRLNYGTLGVAARTLPCGTRLRMRLNGRTLRVRVIDYGPAKWTGRTFDLTYATARYFGVRYPWKGAVRWRLAR